MCSNTFLYSKLTRPESQALRVLFSHQDADFFVVPFAFHRITNLEIIFFTTFCILFTPPSYGCLKFDSNSKKDCIVSLPFMH